MEEPLINRVANSPLISLDLAQFRPKAVRTSLDLASFLDQGLVLREREFRAQMSQLDTTKYHNKFVRLYCSSSAILPAWAYHLVTVTLAGQALIVVQGTESDLELMIWADALAKLDLSPYYDKPVIIKGCDNELVPQTAYLTLIQRLQPITKQLMYGEACSAVPLFKRNIP
ncbi:MAG: hypothetical protein ABR84_04045 [Cryomorphaceae bacterium BACL21 MAG-121220-bin10]|jgi:hypothetical protein|nr:MAG: hypothetical protein ABR84_04045 [Cryomorphaceae bacterium BACL21 MAG-121220-bin10]MDA0700915.1 DUF2480 family protein [Bacteroidota bacterium]|tara:strand:+ start:10549 stop:11061 length:513 start_codon:yes stop_codon:yes gene_type:complete